MCVESPKKTAVAQHQEASAPQVQRQSESRASRLDIIRMTWIVLLCKVQVWCGAVTLDSSRRTHRSFSGYINDVVARRLGRCASRRSVDAEVPLEAHSARGDAFQSQERPYKSAFRSDNATRRAACQLGRTLQPPQQRTLRGQPDFRVQAFPFRATAARLPRSTHRHFESPHPARTNQCTTARTNRLNGLRHGNWGLDQDKEPNRARYIRSRFTSRRGPRQSLAVCVKKPPFRKRLALPPLSGRQCGPYHRHAILRARTSCGVDFLYRASIALRGNFKRPTAPSAASGLPHAAGTARGLVWPPAFGPVPEQPFPTKKAGCRRLPPILGLRFNISVCRPNTLDDLLDPVVDPRMQAKW